MSGLVKDPENVGRSLASGATALEPLFLLAALFCLVILPLRFAPFGLGLIALSWLARLLATGRLTVRTPADWPLALLVLMIPVTLHTTALPEITRQALTYLAAGLATFNTVTNWTQNEERLWLAAWALAGMGTVLALLAPVGVRWFSRTRVPFIPESIYRAMPLLLRDPIHPNIMAGALALIAPLPLALLLLGGGEVRETLPRRLRLDRAARPALAMAWLLMVAILFLAQSRGGYVATAIAAAVLLTLWRPWMSLTFLVMAEAAALAWSRVGWQGLADWLFSTGAITSWQGRVQLWSRALAMIRDFPLTGIGMGTINQVTSALYPLPWDDADIVGHSHNLFLQVGVDLGLPGLIAYLALWLTATFLTWRAYRALRHQGRPALSALAAGLGASLAALGIHGLFDAATWGSKPAFLAWAALGLAVALPDALAQGGPIGLSAEEGP
jgi:putative inorganic carbon (HCO3(-)) transporter